MKYVGCFFLILFLSAWFFERYNLIYPLPLICTFFCFMIAILEWKVERIIKGVSLISYGILLGIFLAKAIIYSEELAKTLPMNVIDNLEIFKNLVIFSCSGAGGSIIANHAERFLSEKDISPQQEIRAVNYDKQFRVLQHELTKTRTYLIYFSSAILILFLIILAMII
ncbi:hypothetical protein CS369_02120 [Candidatus Symbiopectobacterium sp. 'North America']|nr:hypothetical protein [Candidatus Symbiopectobacterium sp. 'North America']